MNSQNHLPMIGVGPLIVIPQLLLTALGVVLSILGFLGFGKIDILKTPFLIIGVIVIFFGIYMWFSANFKTKVDKYITENKLATTGTYGIVRNPIYSAFYLVNFGTVLIASNWILFIIPILCWIYMTIFLKQTEEKWLLNLYGQEYIDYCKKVNRIIPWFTKN